MGVTSIGHRCLIGIDQSEVDQFCTSAMSGLGPCATEPPDASDEQIALGHGAALAAEGP
jgi:hypothetical protein